MVNVNVVDRVTPPVPITIISYAPAGADEETVIVQTLVNVGLPYEGLKDTATANAI